MKKFYSERFFQKEILPNSYGNIHPKIFTFLYTSKLRDSKSSEKSENPYKSVNLQLIETL